MEEAHISVLRAEMERIGYRAEADGCYHVAEPLIAFTHQLWAALSEGDEPPLERIGRLVPAFADAYRKDLSYRLTDDLRREKTGASEYADEFLASFLRLPTAPEAWLNAPVRVNIGLLVDGWSEYTVNVTYPAYNWQDYDTDYEGQFHTSSIMWLTRRQGYKQAELREALYSVKAAVKKEDPLTVIPSPFLYSAAMEVWHELSIFNQLGFFLKMPLREMLLMDAMKRWGHKNRKWQGYILLDKKTASGFFSTWNGSCSLLGLELEKDVKIPLGDVEIFPDGGEGYSIYDVIASDEKWRPDCILHWGLPRQFRRDAALWGITELPPGGGAAKNAAPV